MYKVAGLVGILTILSKILGLGRDLVIANYFGTSMMADAFNMAYLFTGNFFILFGGIGGPFYSSIVAVLPKLKGRDPESVKKFLKSILIKTSTVLVFLTALLYFTKGFILQFFIDPAREEYFNMTLFHINVLLPLILICGPIGILFGVLNVYKRYVAPSLSPAVVNVALIASIFLMGDSMNGLALSLGTALGAVASLFFQFPGYLAIKKKLNGFFKGEEDLVKIEEHAAADQPAGGSMAAAQAASEGTVAAKIKDQFLSVKDQIADTKRKYAEILYPALLATGISQGVVYVDSYFCDGLGEGSWTSVVMANRLIQLPLGVLLTAFLVPLFPRLSELAGDDNFSEMKVQVKKALRALVLICIPATLVGVFFAQPIIKLLFERGAFTANSTAMVSLVFFWLCFSIIPYIYRDTVTRVFYSLGDSRTPLYVAIAAIVFKVILNYFLVASHGLAGIAIATVLMTLLNFLILSLLLKRKTGSFMCFAV